MTIKAVLFDKDGTLYDFSATFAPATQLVINALAGKNEELAGKLADAVDFDREKQSVKPGSVLIAGSLDDISAAWQPVLQDYNVDAPDSRLDDLYIKYSSESLAPFEALEPTLDALSAMNLHLGVATNDSETAALSHLDNTGITHRFAYIAGYDSGHGAKPGPGMVLAFAEQSGIAPGDVVMVGDSTHDCQAGRAAGAITIAVTSGLAGEEDLAPHADYVLAGIGELPSLIARLNEDGETL